jgi:hypothetical protein
VVVANAGDVTPRALEERGAEYELELWRSHLPRFLLWNGTEPALDVADGEPDTDVLQGQPAWAGQAVGCARVILEPTGGRLHPGVILLAPFTDPDAVAPNRERPRNGDGWRHGTRRRFRPRVRHSGRGGLAGATERRAHGQMVAVNATTGTVS